MHYVEWGVKNRQGWHSRRVECATAAEAYRLWLSLPRGIIAKLYQDGELRGNG